MLKNQEPQLFEVWFNDRVQFIRTRYSDLRELVEEYQQEDPEIEIEYRLVTVH